MNPVLMIAYNNLELTKGAVASVLAQDIPVDIYFVDNGSTDGTWDWVQAQSFTLAVRKPRNESVVKIANELATQIFDRSDSNYLLGVPNDVRLPPNCYSQLLRWPRGFVCASDNGPKDLDFSLLPASAFAVSENTPMGVMLTRKWAYQAILVTYGYFFDEKFFHYASDCDLALRMAACGIRGVQLDLPYWHFGSASLKLAPPEYRLVMELWADADRAYFQSKWGFRVDSLEYGKRPADLNFKGLEKGDSE